MSEDPIVDAVRVVRRQHAEQFGFDLRAIVEDIQRQEQNSGARFIIRPHRKATMWQTPIAQKRREAADRPG